MIKISKFWKYPYRFPVILLASAIGGGLLFPWLYNNEQTATRAAFGHPFHVQVKPLPKKQLDAWPGEGSGVYVYTDKERGFYIYTIRHNDAVGISTVPMPKDE